MYYPSPSMYSPSPCYLLSLIIVRKLIAKDEVWMAMKIIAYSKVFSSITTFLICRQNRSQAWPGVKNLANFTRECQDWSAGLEPHGKKYEIHETVFMILMIVLFIDEFRLDFLVRETLHTTSDASNFCTKCLRLWQEQDPGDFLVFSIEREGNFTLFWSWQLQLKLECSSAYQKIKSKRKKNSTWPKSSKISLFPRDA